MVSCSFSRFLAPSGIRRRGGEGEPAVGAEEKSTAGRLADLAKRDPMAKLMRVDVLYVARDNGARYRAAGVFDNA